ncbi:MAG: potassium transporter TrkA [Pyrinomonadaceae bacterium]|nr:potassium transporter TrkA [Pyrinomonadaceae bacterium]
MKFLSSQFAYLFSDREMQANLRSLLRYVALLAAVITAYAIIFHFIMLYAEGRSYSWITGFYWTLTVMTTLGFGDITFESDTGRLFSIIVLLSGVVMLLVMLPFLFIRLFYAPWLEARLQLTAPRKVADETRDHVIIASYDSIAVGLIKRLRTEKIPYVVIEPDPSIAAEYVADEINVVTGEIDRVKTYTNLKADQARLVVANREDTTNTNITLHVRELTASTPIATIVEDEDSVDILELSGATHVLALKHQLGEYLANRVSGVTAEARIIGNFKSLKISELPVANTPLAGQKVSDTQLREKCGLNIVGIWERGHLLPAFPDTLISERAVVVLVGTEPQIKELNKLLPRREESYDPVIIIGSGKIGLAAARALKRIKIPVHVLDKDEKSLDRLKDLADASFLGDAADHEVLKRAGLERASTVLLTTNDDAMNIYLAVYCRRLNSNLRIVSRITDERNVEAIHRAGADFVLSYASLGVEAIFAFLRQRGPVILGEGVDLFSIPVPKSLAGMTLRETGIGSRTGLSVVAVQQGDEFITQLSVDMRIEADAKLITLGSLEQRSAFTKAFE